MSFCHRFAAALLFAAALPASAASFDCAKARTDVEKAICADRQLSTLDEKLGRAWRGYLATAQDPASERARQQEWLKSRAICGTSVPNECLAGQYETRAAYLSAITGALKDLNGGERRTIGKSTDDYWFQVRLIDECTQSCESEGDFAILYIFRKGEKKPFQHVSLPSFMRDPGDLVFVQDLRDGIKVLYVHSGRNGLHSTASHDLYVAKPGGVFVYSPELTKLAEDTAEGVEIDNGEFSVLSSDSGPTRGTRTWYALIGDKPVIARREILDGESDQKYDMTTYEAYRSGKLVKRWTRKVRR